MEMWDQYSIYQSKYSHYLLLGGWTDVASLSGIDCPYPRPAPREASEDDFWCESAPSSRSKRENTSRGDRGRDT
jgi:hypothetical protein